MKTGQSKVFVVCGTAENYIGGKYQYGEEEDGDIELTSHDNVKEIWERYKDADYFLRAVVDKIRERIDLPNGTETRHTLFQFHQKG